jgi:hypothetical protein
MQMQRPGQTVIIEAIVIGIMNAGLYYLLQATKIVVPVHILLMLCGALIHIIFEYTGGNQWWCRQTYKCP